MDGCQSVSKKGSPKLQSLAWAGSLYLSLGWLCCWVAGFTGDLRLNASTKFIKETLSRGDTEQSPAEYSFCFKHRSQSWEYLLLDAGRHTAVCGIILWSNYNYTETLHTLQLGGPYTD